MHYERISPTAETIAFVRDTVAIPYANEIAHHCDARRRTEAFYRTTEFAIDLERMKKLATWARIRLYSLMEITKRSGVRNILELASGFSPAGLIMSEDPSVTYVESDLPSVIRRKEKLARKILHPPRPNLLFGPANALSRDQMEELVDRHFPSGPIAVCNEGLLQYLTHDEKRTLASNIHSILQTRDGVWATADIVLKKHFESAFSATTYAANMRTVLTKRIGRDMATLAFESYEEAERFFIDVGFRIERYRQSTLVPHLVSNDDLRRRAHLQHQEVWVMKCR